MILITGASGTVGGAVLAEMLKSGQSFRAMYRNQDDARKAPPGISTVLADFASKDSLASTLTGVDTLFLVCSPIPQLVELESNVIDVSLQRGVKHIVLNSALGAGDYPKSFPSWHRAVEDKLKASGLSCTILRPNGFMQNILAYNAPSIRTQGSFYAALGDARISHLDVRDIAAVVARILNSPGDHTGRTYELNGPQAVSNAELAKRISAATGRTVSYVDIPESVQRKNMLDLGMPEWQVNALLELQQYYVQGGANKVTDVLPNLLGRPPVHLDSFLAEFKEHFLTQSAGA
jgi:uncharacterized protein YbjT (DUF2867 family)